MACKEEIESWEEEHKVAYHGPLGQRMSFMFVLCVEAERCGSSEHVQHSFFAVQAMGA